jgi:uncharacterized protein
MSARLPIDEQVTALRTTLSKNAVLTQVLERTAELKLPGWYLTGDCLVQTVWNVSTGRPPAQGIKDYDVFYFDGTDLSREAEDAVIADARGSFEGLPAKVELHNQARVHLWYEEKHGVPCGPYSSTGAAIDSFAATTCCLGVRVEDGDWRIYAPHGMADVFDLVVRPNPVLAPRKVYEEKTRGWRREWPELTVMDWPASS